MADYIYENLVPDQQIAFNPGADTFILQDASWAASMLLLDHNQTTSQNLRLHLFDDTEDKDIFFLNITPGELTAADFVFGGGGQVLIGDLGPGTASDNSANTINGTAGGDFILGMGGNDTLSGGAGDDFFSFFVNGHFAGPGVDSVNGGAGFDVVNLGDNESTLGVTIDLQAGTVTGYMPGAGATLVSIEGVEGSNKGDSIVGSAAGNFIDGYFGNDTIFAGLGNDSVLGMDGNDVIDGGSGIDTLLLNDGDFGADVDLQSGVVRDDFGDVDTVSRFENVVGSQSNDQISGDGGANVLEGGKGRDELEGRGDKDTLLGGGSSDTLNGGTGSDRLIGGAGNDTLDGKAGSDRLLGGTGSDKLVWGAGDRIDGGAGADTLKLTRGDLDLTNPEIGEISGIETIDMRAGSINALTLVRQDVLELSTTDTLRVLGDANDTVNAIGFTQIADLQGFNRYTSGAATLLVETDVNVIT